MKKFSDLLLERLNVPKEKKWEYFAFLLFALALPFLSVYFPKLGSGLLIFLASVIFVFTWVMAGVAIFRALLVPSAVMSVVIFLAETYCNLPKELWTANDSLKVIFAFGFSYSFFLFLKALYKNTIKADKNKDEARAHLELFKEINKGKNSWILLGFYALSMFMFVSQFYQVIKPIVNHLCIYQDGNPPLP